MALTLDHTSNGGASPASFSHTCSTNAILFVGISGNGGTVSSVTYGGDSMTLLASASSSSGNVYWYFLATPKSGANNVVVNNSYAGFTAGGISFLGGSLTQGDGSNSVNGTTPNTGSPTNENTSLTTTVDGDYLLDVLFSGSATPSAQSGQTLYWSNSGFFGGYWGGGAYVGPKSVGTYTNTWSIPSLEEYCILTLAIKVGSISISSVSDSSTASENLTIYPYVPIDESSQANWIIGVKLWEG